MSTGSPYRYRSGGSKNGCGAVIITMAGIVFVLWLIAHLCQ